MTDPESQRPRVWVVLDGAPVPRMWEERARPATLIPLLPDEAEALLVDDEVRSATTPEQAEFLALVAAGRPASYIARRLGISDRSVFRRLASWRDRFGVESTAELAAELSKRGF
jgi:DNA-binding NarL/FixJ family response regulator